MSLHEHGFLSPEIEQYREKIRLKNQHFFKLAETLNSYGQQIKYQLKIYNRDGQQVFAGCLLIKLLNDIQAAMILFERGLVSQGRSMLRISLESLIVLGKICESYEFVHAYAKIGENDRLKLVRAIRDAPTEMFEDIKPELTNELINKIEETIEGTHVQRVLEQWAKDIGLLHLYVSAYRLFSQDVHSSPKALNEYFMENEEKEIIGFESWPKGDEDLRVELLEASRFLIYGMSFINKLFELRIDEQLKTFDNQYAEMDGSAMEGTKIL